MNHFRFILTPFLFVEIFVVSASAEIIPVTPYGPITIQEAIDFSSPGDIIDLADGVFLGDGNRDLDFQGKAITVRSQSGDPTTCIIDCEGSDLENHRAFYFRHYEDSDSIVEGLTMRNGYHTYSGGIQGGWHCAPTIRNCHFINNHGNDGAGLFIEGAATIENCWFEGNVSSQRGGAATVGFVSSGSNPTFTGCTFVNNTAGYYGGAFRC
jgi:hypothetical protein